MKILGIVAGIVAIVGLYVVTMVLYTGYRKRHAEEKNRAEVFTVGFALLFSIVLKTIIAFFDIPETFGGGFAGILHGLYSALGGLGFEGLVSLSEISSPLLQCLYTGSSIYAGFVFVSVITTTVSYELYSFCRLMIIRYVSLARHKRKLDLYIFGSVTEDSLILAKSIVDQYRQDDKKTRGKKFEIIFSGDELEAFDRKDALHREIMANGFIYWSFFKINDDRKAKSVLKRLGLYIDNDFFANKQEKDEEHSRIHIFALVNNQKISGLESVNSDIVFGEIRSITREIISQKTHKQSIVDLYVLTDNEINYRYYQDCLAKIINGEVQKGDIDNVKKYIAPLLKQELLKLIKTFKNFGITDCSPVIEETGVNNFGRKVFEDKEMRKKAQKAIEECLFYAEKVRESINALPDERKKFFFEGAVNLVEEEVQNAVDFLLSDKQNDQLIRGLCCDLLKRHFQLHIINEAVLTGKSLAARRIYLLESERQSIAFDKANKSIDGKEQTNPFLLANKPNKDGTYRVIVFGFGNNGQQAMNYLFTDTAYVDDDTGKPSQFIANVFDAQIGEKGGLFTFTHPLYACTMSETACPVISSVDDREKHFSKITSLYPPDYSPKDLCDFVGFPIAFFHSANCFDLTLLDYIDKKQEGSLDSCKCLYDAFIVALGNDEGNITMGNALIDDIKHEKSYQNAVEDTYPQTIYINIRDEKNYNRINWTESDQKAFSKVRVITFGSRKEMYSYKHIIDDSEDMKFNYGYTLINSNRPTSEKVVEEINEVLSAAAEDDCSSSLKDGKAVLDGMDLREAREVWLFTKVSDKESSSAASRFSVFISEKMRDVKPITAKLLLTCAQLEHVRWDRFNIVGGWTYATKKNKHLKEHCLLIPWSFLNDDDKRNDLVNVVKSYKGEEK